MGKSCFRKDEKKSLDRPSSRNSENCYTGKWTLSCKKDLLHMNTDKVLELGVTKCP